MRFRSLSFALLLVTGVCLSQNPENEPRTVSTSRFSVEYPPGGEWRVGIEVRELFDETDPLDAPEESIEFSRSTPGPAGEERDSRVFLNVLRQWPTIDECLVRPQDSRNQRESLRRMDKIFKNIKDGDSRMFVQELRQCAETIEEYVELHFAHAEFLFREITVMSGGAEVAVFDEGKEVVEGKTIYFVRFEAVQRPTSERMEMARYVWLPPSFGAEDLLFYEVSTIASCKSRESCELIEDTNRQSLAVLASLQPLTGDAPPQISGEQAAAEKYFEAKLLPGDGMEFDKFGDSVDVSGGAIAVVAGCSLPACRDRASTYIFAKEEDSGSWAQHSKLVADDKGERRFLSSLAFEHDTVAIGGINGAHVFVQSSDKAEWDEQIGLSISGIDVAITKNTVVIGAPFEDCRYTHALCEGEAYVYHRDGLSSRWADRVHLEASAPPPPYLFGSSVAIDGNVIAVGAPGYATRSGGKWGSYDGEDSGAVYVFTSEGANREWNTDARLMPDDSTPRDEFGSELAMQGGTLLVGAAGEKKRGCVYVFVYDRSPGSWRQTQKLTPDTTGESSWRMTGFGDAIAMDGNTIVVGAPYESGLRKSTGAVYVYRYDDSSGKWEHSVKLKAPDAMPRDYFGRSVAIEGETVVIGAPGDSDNGRSSGSAYIFNLQGGTTTSD